MIHPSYHLFVNIKFKIQTYYIKWKKKSLDHIKVNFIYYEKVKNFLCHIIFLYYYILALTLFYFGFYITLYLIHFNTLILITFPLFIFLT